MGGRDRSSLDAIPTRRRQWHSFVSWLFTWRTQAALGSLALHQRPRECAARAAGTGNAVAWRVQRCLILRVLPFFDAFLLAITIVTIFFLLIVANRRWRQSLH